MYYLARQHEYEGLLTNKAVTNKTVTNKTVTNDMSIEERSCQPCSPLRITRRVGQVKIANNPLRLEQRQKKLAPVRCLVSKQGGMTLIELMVVLGIIGVLVAVAYPSYVDYIRKARRSDAADALHLIQSLQEKHRANNTTYDDIVTIGYSAADPSPSADGHYNMTVTGDSATAYTITATAIGSQASDIVACRTLTLVVSAADSRGSLGQPTCWSN